MTPPDAYTVGAAVSVHRITTQRELQARELRRPEPPPPPQCCHVATGTFTVRAGTLHWVPDTPDEHHRWCPNNHPEETP